MIDTCFYIEKCLKPVKDKTFAAYLPLNHVKIKNRLKDIKIFIFNTSNYYCMYLC